MTISRNMCAAAIVLAAVFALGMLAGCGKPQTAPENRDLISSLRTAVNTRNAEWLEKNADLVDERRNAGQMADPEYEEFQAILALARAGQWERAERETIAFQKAQRPTRDEVQGERRLRR